MGNSILNPLDLASITEAVWCDIENAHHPGALLPGPIGQAWQGDDALQIFRLPLPAFCNHAVSDSMPECSERQHTYMQLVKHV